MASREGTVVLLEDLIREATSRALAIVQTKNPDLPLEVQEDVAKAVALGAIRYSMVARENTKVVTFDWETALNFEGQAAPYIQYAYVRANSILRKAGSAVPDKMPSGGSLSETEIVLVDLISRFPREIERSAAELSPLGVANWLFDLAQAFNDFYNKCPVLTADEPARSTRLQLVMATRQTLANGLALLGITAPQAM